MKDKIFITGGTGTVGINLIHKLVQEKKNIFVLYRYKKKLYPFKKINKNINFIKLDLQNKKKLHKIINKIKPNVIFHLASSYFNPPNLDLQKHVDINFFNTFNLINAIEKIKLKKFIFTGSAAVYGEGTNIAEKNLYNFNNSYGFSKSLCSKFLMSCNSKKIPITELRFFSIYGDWEKKNRLVPSAIRSAINKKKFRLLSIDQIRDYIYVEDAVKALILAYKKHQKNGIFNICSSKKQSTHNLAKEIYKKFNLKKNKIVKTNYAKTNIIKELVGKNSKAKKELNWVPKFSIDEGLNKTISWLRKNYK